MSTTIATIMLAGLVILMLVISGRQKLTAGNLALTGLCAALCVVLDLLAVYRLPQGGSITLGKMVPLFVLANICGWRVGLLGGAIVAMLDFFVSPYIVHPVQFLLDYPLAYMSLAVAGIFPYHRIIGGYGAVFLRFVCHFLSGMVFFAAYAPEGIPAWQYSLSVNGIWLAIEGSIAVLIYRLLPLELLWRR